MPHPSNRQSGDRRRWARELKGRSLTGPIQQLKHVPRTRHQRQVGRNPRRIRCYSSPASETSARSKKLRHTHLPRLVDRPFGGICRVSPFHRVPRTFFALVCLATAGHSAKRRNPCSECTTDPTRPLSAVPTLVHAILDTPGYRCADTRHAKTKAIGGVFARLKMARHRRQNPRKRDGLSFGGWH